MKSAGDQNWWKTFLARLEKNTRRTSFSGKSLLPLPRATCHAVGEGFVMAKDLDRTGCRGRAGVLLFLILATALITLGLMIYTLIERPQRDRLTPVGANYNPGRTQGNGMRPPPH